MTTNTGSRFHEEHQDAYAGGQPPSYDMAAPTSPEVTGTGTGTTESASGVHQSSGSSSGHEHSNSNSSTRPLSQGSTPPAGSGGRLFKGAIQ